MVYVLSGGHPIEFISFDTRSEKGGCQVDATQLIALQGLGGLAVVIALVQVAKPFVKDESLWPLMAIALGIGWNLLLVFILNQPTTWGYALVMGIVTGLAASGAYSAGKTLRGQ